MLVANNVMQQQTAPFRRCGEGVISVACVRFMFRKTSLARVWETENVKINHLTSLDIRLPRLCLISVHLYFTTNLWVNLESGNCKMTDDLWSSFAHILIFIESLLCPRRGAKYGIEHVCLCVSAVAYLKNNVSRLHKIFCRCYMWPWLSPALITVQYVLYLRFCGWRNICP